MPIPVLLAAAAQASVPVVASIAGVGARVVGTFVLSTLTAYAVLAGVSAGSEIHTRVFTKKTAGDLRREVEQKDREITRLKAEVEYASWHTPEVVQPARQAPLKRAA